MNAAGAVVYLTAWALGLYATLVMAPVLTWPVVLWFLLLTAVTAHNILTGFEEGG